jgi:quinol monooxygenase YgiN
MTPMMLHARMCFSKLVLTILAAAVLIGVPSPRVMAQNAAAQNTTAQNRTGRVFVVSHVDVIPKYAEDAAKTLLAYGADSRKDAGSVRIDVLVENGPNHFTLVEVWESRAAYEAHVAQDHTRAFREKVHPWLGSPYDERMSYEVK